MVRAESGERRRRWRGRSERLVPHKSDLLFWKNLFLLVMFYFVGAIPRRAQTNLFVLGKIIFSALFNLYLASFV